MVAILSVQESGTGGSAQSTSVSDIDNLAAAANRERI